MRHAVRHPFARGLAAATALVLVASCTSSSDGDSDAADDSPSPDDVIEKVTVVTAGGEVEARVHPLVAVDDHLVLTVDLVATEIAEGDDFGVPGSRFDGDATLTGSSFGPEEAGALRLVDAASETIHLAATDSDGESVGSASRTTGFYVPESGFRLQRAFAAPAGDPDTVGLLLPGTYLDAVPIVDGEVPAPILKGQDEKQTEGADLPADLDDVAEAPVLPLEGYTRQLEGAVEVIESTEKVEIRLSGDVLFATGSFVLNPGAAEAIDAAVATIESYDDGVINVVGHTDDVGDDASNQTLSDQRATPVAEALKSQIGADAYEIKAEGRGETEPLVANDSDENRQLNRRVTLTLTSEKTDQTEVSTSGQTPPFKDGPLKDGAEADATTWFERVERDGYSYRGLKTGYSSQNAALASRILIGSTAAYPLDYRLGDSKIEGDTEWRYASDTSASDFAGGGETLRFVALYRDVPGATSITLEQPFVLGTTPWRLNNIPVED